MYSKKTIIDQAKTILAKIKKSNVVIANKNDFLELCKKFIYEINKNSKIVKLEIKDMNFREYKESHEASWDLNFQAIFDFKDPYIKEEYYKRGEAFIYLSKKFYDDVEKTGKEIFDQKPNWNNTATIGWFAGSSTI